MHRRLDTWPAARCEPVCILQRFPARLAAEWDLVWKTHTPQQSTIVTPGGASSHTSYRFSITDFVTYADRVIGLKRRHWEPLINRLQAMQAWWSQHREGKFPFTKQDFEELKAIGLPVEAPDAGSEDRVPGRGEPRQSR